MNDNKIHMYGADWCPDCRRAKHFFQKNNIDYVWHDTDSNPEAAEFVRQANHGERIIPTIIFPDGSMLVEPSNAELSAKFGRNA